MSWTTNCQGWYPVHHMHGYNIGLIWASNVHIALPKSDPRTLIVGISSSCYWNAAMGKYLMSCRESMSSTESLLCERFKNRCKLLRKTELSVVSTNHNKPSQTSMEAIFKKTSKMISAQSSTKHLWLDGDLPGKNLQTADLVPSWWTPWPASRHPPTDAKCFAVVVIKNSLFVFICHIVSSFFPLFHLLFILFSISWKFDF